jgi:adenosylhomocysteinase
LNYEAEMPGLMALRAEYKDEQPLAGSRMLDVCNPNCGFDQTLIALGLKLVFL